MKAQSYEDRVHAAEAKVPTLPKWAQNLIAHYKHQIRDAERRRDEAENKLRTRIYTRPGKTSCPVDFDTRVHVPEDLDVELPDGTLSLIIRDDRLLSINGERPIVVHPSASNVITIRCMSDEEYGAPCRKSRKR